MSGESDNFATFRNNFTKKFEDTKSELYGYLGTQSVPAVQEYTDGNVTTTTTRTVRTIVSERDADGNTTTCVYEGDNPPTYYAEAPIKTKLKTYYSSSNDQQVFDNDDWFESFPKPQKFQDFNPVMSNRAFGKRAAEKPNMDTFRSLVLEAHNNYRIKHGVGPLKLSDCLNQQAQKWADNLSELNCMQHSENEGGENLYACSSSDPNYYPTAQEVCDSWYNEIKDYTFGRDPSGLKTVGHFTQMVWRTNDELGVGLAKSRDGAVYVVANYNPGGNVEGQYAANVFPAGSKPVRPAVPAQPRTISNNLLPPGQVRKQKGSAPDDTRISQFRQRMLNAHNMFRAKHGVKYLVLSDKLNKFAQEWAQIIANRKQASHRPNNQYGENIHHSWSSDGRFPNPEEATESFYKEIKLYTFGGGDPVNWDKVGHFTQLVWANTKELGIGMAQSNNDWFIVCNYSPAGNVNGLYRNNVFRPISQAKPKVESNQSVIPAPPPPPPPQKTKVQESSGRPAPNNNLNIKEYRQRVLNTHNILRARHGVKSLTLSDKLNNFAQEWAENLANSDVFEHRDSNSYGENMAASWTSDGQLPNPEKTTQGFYDEIKDYTFGADPVSLKKVGHFTQLVWADSKELGVGVAQSPRSQKWYTVCNYDPAGNYKGEYRDNVFRPTKSPASPIIPKPLPTTQDNLEQFRKQLLIEHNLCRSQHGADPMELSNDINQAAQKWAEYLAKQDELEHNCDSSYGENISTYLSFEPNYYPSAKEVCKDFYDEIADYKFGGDPTGGAHVEHFTQMVWRASTQLGAGVAKSESGSYYVVVNYSPRGNYAGEFKNNVLPKGSSKPQVTAAPPTVPVQAPTPVTSLTPAYIKPQLNMDVPPMDDGAQNAKLERFKKLALNQHNMYRKKHDVPFLKISAELNKSAQEWADQCAAEGELLDHDESFSYGESVNNISSYETDYYPDAEEICRDFYNEVADYKYAADPGNANVLDFTQMVWKSTTEFGVGIAKSENEDFFIVFHYNPRGNVEGQFRSNVFRPKSVFVPQPDLPTKPIEEPAAIVAPTEEELDAEAEYKNKIQQFRNMILAIHNMYRMRHGAPELKITEELDIYAQESAELLAEADFCRHRPDCKYGENCSRYASDDPDYFPSAETVCYDYYKEINLYRWSGTPDKSEKVFHFTQLVWCDSVQIGIGFAKSKTNQYYIVINYNPRGNVEGAFEDNVYPLGTAKRPPKRIVFVAPTVTPAVQQPKGTLNIEKFIKLLCNQHNIYRKHHGAKFVKISKTLNVQAQEWADECAKNDMVDYRQGKYGENIYAEFGPDSSWYPTAEEVGKHFYDGYKKYKYGPTPDPGTEEFTQMIWNSCAEIGVGVAKADSGRVFVVVNYSPRGNVAGKYAENVLRVGGVSEKLVTMNIIAK